MTIELAAPNWASFLGRDDSENRPIRFARAARASVLVTGAGGFIGAEMVRVLAASGAETIVLLDLCEQRLFAIASEMAERGFAARCVPVVGSVCDADLLEALFAEHRPDLVVHAAALKHVPLMEANPLAAVATNALGTWTVARAAENHGARQMLLVSTDKAAAPRSIMGAAKRIAELVMLAPSRTLRTAVRLVNVIGSPGSVGPIFAEQITRGGPVTVTHPEARRYFFTLRETVRLLGEAIDAQPQGLLVPDPGEPLPIAELAQRMIAASGRNVPIDFSELRPGEKLDEVLLAPGENLGTPASSLLRRAAGPADPYLLSHLNALAAAVAQRDGNEALRLVRAMVPGYEPSPLVRASLEATAEAAAPLP